MQSQADAPPIRPASVWVVTDGKAGDETQCIGVAEAMGLVPVIHHIAPRPPFAWFLPYGPVDPREQPGAAGSPLQSPWPDVVITSGRRAVRYGKAIKTASGGRTFTAILKDPRAGTGLADFIWVPAHDKLRGESVLVTLTSPHRISAAKLATARSAMPDWMAALPPGPKVAVLIGGDSRHYRFTDESIRDLAQKLAVLAASGVALMGTLSRRTPPALAVTIKHVVEHHRGWLWDGTGDNPLIPLMAHADALIVTADSVNMVGEAAATGKPVLVFTPPAGKGRSGHRKIETFLAAMRAKGIVHNFAGRLEGDTYPP
ncbi:MAG: mitochondrial fission ELM1 family protein, partial [Beijerinckiaceae bacterium]